jgi:hypothetical protein
MIGLLIERVIDVDYKTVLHVTVNKPLEGLVDIIYLDDLNLRIDFVRCTEVNHFLGVLCASDKTTSQASCT